jgi:tubulin monoglycylase TTLL3/8
VYFYHDCYLRFSAQEYDLADLDIFSHLCNNSISKYHSEEQIEGKVAGNKACKR